MAKNEAEQPKQDMDKAYAIEGPRALGRWLGEVFNGMLLTGMERGEALAVVTEIASSQVFASAEAKAAQEEDE